MAETAAVPVDEALSWIRLQASSILDRMQAADTVQCMNIEMDGLKHMKDKVLSLVVMLKG
jgi:hypothetical protein